MGAACCCSREVNSEDYSALTNCMWLRCFVQQFASLYAALFLRGRHAAVYSSIQGTASLDSPGEVSSSFDTSVLETHQSPPRPLPYGVDPRSSHFQSGPISRHEKSKNHYHEQSEPIRSDNYADRVAVRASGKWSGHDCEGGSKIIKSEYSTREVINDGLYVFCSSEDDNVCPTCLEDYTAENPRIITQCSHHFHLGCIYEWMERSDSCPICGKVMVFNEPA